MQQVLLRIPVPFLPEGIPVYGFGMMLFVAFILCTWLAGRLARREGVARERIQDLAIWLFVGGLVGARLTSMISDGVELSKFFHIWEGGMVLYGAILGALAGYLLAYRLVIIKHGLSTWQLADILAPALALGIGLGRIGCLLNGCCYGHVACPDCVQLSFPLSSPSRFALVHEGLQTAAGFTLNVESSGPPIVRVVESGSAAESAGLRARDKIIKIRDFAIAGKDESLESLGQFEELLTYMWPKGKNTLALTVLRNGNTIDLPPFRPLTLGLIPTQIYETVTMFLAVFLLLAYWPFRKSHGELAAILIFVYGVHRSLNELLRSDDRPVGFERYISLFLIVAGPVLWVWLRYARIRNPVEKAAPTAAG